MQNLELAFLASDAAPQTLPTPAVATAAPAQVKPRAGEAPADRVAQLLTSAEVLLRSAPGLETRQRDSMLRRLNDILDELQEAGAHLPS